MKIYKVTIKDVCGDIEEYFNTKQAALLYCASLSVQAEEINSDHTVIVKPDAYHFGNFLITEITVCSINDIQIYVNEMSS